MKKIFEEYGSSILVIIVAVAFVGIIGLMYNGNGTGWLEVAFQKQGLTEVQKDVPSTDDTEIVTVYSPDFIDNNPYLFSIGATKPEYVVAAFNMNFSEVFILPNGATSDGKMANLNSSNSPFILHTETIKTVVIEKGVSHIGDNAFDSCINLESVTISSSVESISSTAFSSCSALKTIYGESGSFAETYANEKGYLFVAVQPS